MALNKNIKAFFCSIVSALLCFIIVFNLSFNAFHIQTEKHHHAEQNCSPDEENDACHRYLIHHEKSNSCNGEHEHFTQKSDECFACNYFKNQQPYFEVEKVTLASKPFSSFTYSSKQVTLKKSFSFTIFSRGPPTIS
ncbi:MAG: hypothetical protein KA163_07450 [Bacteroidia bacterium]|nr:hypothetical protein [Bacteroidia bacterium]